MPAPFAALEARLNAAAIAQLSNAVATIGAASVSGVFDSAYGESLNGMVAGFVPAFTCASADVAGVAKNTAVSVNGVSYLVEEINPDGTGITVLKLEAV